MHSKNFAFFSLTHMLNYSEKIFDNDLFEPKYLCLRKKLKVRVTVP